MSSGTEIKVKELNSSDTKLDVVALMLNVQKSAVSKIQQKRVGDISITRLKEFIEAVGGEFKGEITLPSGEVISL